MTAAPDFEDSSSAEPEYAAMRQWLKLLNEFDPRAVIVLGPSTAAAVERQVVAVYPEIYRDSATKLAEGNAYGAHWRGSGSPLVAWRNLAGPQSEADREWTNACLSVGIESLVRLEYPLPFGHAFECFAMLGAALNSRAQAAAVVWNSMSVWPAVKLEVTVSRFGISKRELETLRLMAAGRTAREAAKEMAISERTVTFHLTRLMEKLNAENKAEAVQRACSLGMI